MAEGNPKCFFDIEIAKEPGLWCIYLSVLLIFRFILMLTVSAFTDINCTHVFTGLQSSVAIM